jgi:hypothetical protein
VASASSTMLSAFTGRGGANLPGRIDRSLGAVTPKTGSARVGARLALVEQTEAHVGYERAQLNPRRIGVLLEITPERPAVQVVGVDDLRTVERFVETGNAVTAHGVDMLDQHPSAKAGHLPQLGERQS